MAAICDALLLRWEKKRSSPVGRFFSTVGMMFAANTYTILPLFPASHSPLCYEAADRVRGIRLMWQPLPARSGLPGTHWKVKSVNGTLTWGQGDGRHRVKDRLMCDISKHTWVINRLSDADMFSSPFPNLLAFFFIMFSPFPQSPWAPSICTDFQVHAMCWLF